MEPKKGWLLLVAIILILGAAAVSCLIFGVIWYKPWELASQPKDEDAQAPAEQNPVIQPTATFTVESQNVPANVPVIEGTLIPPVTFQNGECACGDYHIYHTVGTEQSLLCVYDGSGGTMKDTHLDISISQQYTVEQLRQSLERDMTFLHDKADNTAPNQPGRTVSTIENDANGFIYMVTDTYQSGGVTFFCGEGRGTFLVNDAFQVSISARSCELSPGGAEGYVVAMENLEDCARAIIAQHAK
jgi:hypothetical protein